MVGWLIGEQIRIIATATKLAPPLLPPVDKQNINALLCGPEITRPRYNYTPPRNKLGRNRFMSGLVDK